MNETFYQIGKDVRELQIRVENIEKFISELKLTKSEQPQEQKPFVKVIKEPVSESAEPFPITALDKLKLMAQNSNTYKMLVLIKNHPGICVHKLVDNVGCSLGVAGVTLTNLQKKKLIYQKKNSISCPASQRTHSAYFIVQPDKQPILQITKPIERIHLPKPKGMSKKCRPYKVLQLVTKKPGMCAHKIASGIDCSLKDVSNLLYHLTKKGLLSVMKNSITCGDSPRLHNGYKIGKPDELKFEPVSKPEPVKAKPKPHGIVTEGSKEAKVLQIISDNPEMCAHETYEKAKSSGLESTSLMRVQAMISALLKKGRIQLVSIKGCKYSQRAHTFYKVTIPITKDTFLNIKEEERKLAQDKYEKDLKEKTKELDLDSIEPNQIYVYRNVLQVIYDNRSRDKICTSFIGARADRSGYTDKGWKILEKTLDRLEQDNLVSHRTMPNYGYSVWKLTSLGFKKLLNLDE